jgi:hypothetical protein
VENGCQLLIDRMEIDKEKVDEFTLALLYLTTFKNKHRLRAWKSHDWGALDRLHASGYIDDPVSKAVILTDEGAERSKRLFEEHFLKKWGLLILGRSLAADGGTLDPRT